MSNIYSSPASGGRVRGPVSRKSWGREGAVQRQGLGHRVGVRMRRGDGRRVCSQADARIRRGTSRRWTVRRLGRSPR